jgi:hypothetical protein
MGIPGAWGVGLSNYYAFRRGKTQMKSLARIGLGAAIALSLFSGVAIAADDNNGDAGVLKSCKWDIVKYAATAKKGEIKATLVKNIDKLSADCKKAIDATH